jgi:DNA-binding MarR family transcriptional regulator
MTASDTQDPSPTDGYRPAVVGGEAVDACDVGRMLLDLAPRILRLESNRLARLEEPLTHRQYRILQRVHQGVTSPTAISKAANVSLAAISESVDALCRRGLATRESDESDRRASRLGLTDAGVAALAAAEEELTDVACLLVEGIDPEHFEELQGSLLLSWRNLSGPDRMRRQGR